MSSIAFHERGWTVRVSGRERAAMGLICSDMLAAQIGKLAYSGPNEKIRNTMVDMMLDPSLLPPVAPPRALTRAMCTSAS